uniref:Anaphylatoxin-like domain-containing protein n=1 Tax=Pelusios castaneus TaxID=367368 RepID=A0A8C8SD65_9SAUR
MRRRRSLQTLQKKQNKVDQYPTALERRCCEAGILENPMGHSCEQRTSRVRLGPPCVAAFLDCCRYAQRHKPGSLGLCPTAGSGHLAEAGPS